METGRQQRDAIPTQEPKELTVIARLLHHLLCYENWEMGQNPMYFPDPYKSAILNELCAMEIDQVRYISSEP